MMSSLLSKLFSTFLSLEIFLPKHSAHAVQIHADLNQAECAPQNLDTLVESFVFSRFPRIELQTELQALVEALTVVGVDAYQRRSTSDISTVTCYNSIQLLDECQWARLDAEGQSLFEKEKDLFKRLVLEIARADEAGLEKELEEAQREFEAQHKPFKDLVHRVDMELRQSIIGGVMFIGDNEEMIKKEMAKEQEEYEREILARITKLRKDNTAAQTMLKNLLRLEKQRRTVVAKSLVVRLLAGPDIAISCGEHGHSIFVGDLERVGKLRNALYKLLFDRNVDSDSHTSTFAFETDLDAHEYRRKTISTYAFATDLDAREFLVKTMKEIFDPKSPATKKLREAYAVVQQNQGVDYHRCPVAVSPEVQEFWERAQEFRSQSTVAGCQSLDQTLEKVEVGFWELSNWIDDEGRLLSLGKELE